MVSERLPARRAEPCFYCKAPIEVGDSIYPIAYGRYGCETCNQDSDLQRRLRIRPATRDAPGYSVKCPTCGVDPAELCLTGSSKKRPLHPGRKALVAVQIGDVL